MKDDVMNRTKVKRGEELTQSKLTNEDILLIRELAEHRDKLRAEASQLTNVKIGEKFGIHTRHVEKILSRESWGHV